MGYAARQSALRRERAPRIVKAYVDAAREILPERFRPDCCLNGTRVCIEVMRKFNLFAEPVVVDLMVSNDAAVRMFNEVGGWPRGDDEVKKWMDQGVWVLQVAGERTDDPNGWPHHMIARVYDMLVDSALGQASRPHKGIELPWVAAFPRGNFLDTEDTITYDAPGGALIGLRARPDVRGYDKISGFQPHRENLMVAAEIASRMFQLLEEG